MRRQLLSGLSALALTLAPLAAGTATLTLAGTEAAFAGGGNGNGGGNGRGNGGGNRSSERGNGNGHGNGHSGDDDGEEDEVRGNGNGRGAIASELKGLNACHASDQARANASENSRVGQLAVYRTKAADAATARGGVTQAQTAYDQFEGTYEGRSVAEIDAAIKAIDAGGDGVADDPANAAVLASLVAERAPAATYETTLAELADDVAEAEGLAQEAQMKADEALLLASNGRELSDEAQAALDECLGG